MSAINNMPRTCVIRFYEDKQDTKPYDAYPDDIVESPGNTVFAIHNWLEMHPEGKVEFVRVGRTQTR